MYTYVYGCSKLDKRKKNDMSPKHSLGDISELFFCSPLACELIGFTHLI